MVSIRQYFFYGRLVKARRFIVYGMSLVLCLSCSQLNTDSRDHFNDSNPFRHDAMGEIADIEFVRVTAEPASQESLQRGKSLYNNYCISCHGPSGKGDGVEGRSLKKTPKNLATLFKKVQNSKLYMVKSKTKGEMPGWKPFFTERNLVDLEHYIRSFN
jgi:mono/diheme cytochrome c family protein